MPRLLEPYRSWRVAAMLPLGFASGLPNPLTGATLTAWLRSAGVDLTTIGALALVSLPYNLKFLWAPLLDRFDLPWLGRRRGWMAALQLGLLLAIAALGMGDPRRAPLALALLALLTASLSASFDVVVDAYRTDALVAAEHAAGTALFVTGYRLALIVAGAGALILSDHLSWSVVYAALAALTAVGMLCAVLAPPTLAETRRPASLREAIVGPLLELLGRPHAGATLAVVLLYKVGDVIAGYLLTPFLLDVGLSRSEIGAIQKGLGLFASIGGALLAGDLVPRLGLRLALLAFGLLQAGANVLYIAVAALSGSRLLVGAAVGIDSLCGGLGTAAFIAFMMSLCDRRFTAFQYALLSSLSTVVGRLLGAGGGWLAERWGWSLFFAITIAAALPALAVLWRLPVVVERREDPARRPG
ncbi:MAG: MFS transporter [Proteobacteria bacterium]|nr:MFS transporter [Pseudomonadota bacterium]